MDTDQHPETPVDDRFRALLEGLRTTIPGVMVLFAFLLTVPLATSFPGRRAASRPTQGSLFAHNRGNGRAGPKPQRVHEAALAGERSPPTARPTAGARA